MTIWILAFLLFGSLGFAGYTRGAIRVAFTLLGLGVAALLAVPLGHVITPAVKALFGAFSVKNPMVIGALAPLFAFSIVLTLFKVAGGTVHKQVEGYYKYKAGDLRLALWERLNTRLGICLGVVNGLIYLLLILVPVYLGSYWTTQIATPGSDAKSVSIINRMGKDLNTTGLIKATRALDPMPDSYYTAGDIVGIVYHNPLSQSRLSHYPPLLALAERSEFKDIGNDKELIEMTQRQAPIGEVLHHPKAQGIINNHALIQEIWKSLVPDLTDLREFMETGKSAKYDGEKILGRWAYNSSASLIALRQSKASVSVTQLKQLRNLLTVGYEKSSFTAIPDHQVFLKDVVPVKPGMIIPPGAAVPDPQNSSGQWQSAGDQYTISLDGKELTATIDGSKLKLTGGWTPVVFTKEE